ncbi:hypothetical protein PG994_005709 [Apiospora phragmitis]|uniref:Uncharacterized protein n=1 Tax=Apiospora phragmitis TaxID=2905665 RepID=A0ABR1VGT9_9PEZI
MEVAPVTEAAPKRQRHLDGVRDARVATLALLGAGPSADHVLALHAAGPASVARRRFQVVDRVAAPVHEGEADAVVGLVRDRRLVAGGGGLSLDCWRRRAFVGEIVVVRVGHIQTRRTR